jgi:hypothetical protein
MTMFVMCPHAYQLGRKKSKGDWDDESKTMINSQERPITQMRYLYRLLIIAIVCFLFVMNGCTLSGWK